MKRYTQEEFDALLVVLRVRQCPTGDYSAVEEFGSFCKFGSDCRFGPDCEFDSFCRLGTGCKFGSDCRLGTGCEFGVGCEFDSFCRLGTGCKFGSDCRLGTGCAIEDGHRLKDHDNAFLQISYAGSEHRLTTAYNTTAGPIIRCGCFLGTLNEFRAAVKKTHGKSTHARVYLGWADLVEIQFGEGV